MNTTYLILAVLSVAVFVTVYFALSYLDEIRQAEEDEWMKEERRAKKQRRREEEHRLGLKKEEPRTAPRRKYRYRRPII